MCYDFCMARKTYTGEGPKDWHEVVGMPDEWDKKNISIIIRKFENNPATRGQIAYFLGQARQERQEVRELKFVKDNKQLNFKRRLVMPSALLDEIKAAYPAMFRDQKQFEWFLRNFPMFNVT